MSFKIVANWKMNFTLQQSTEYCEKLFNDVSDLSRLIIAVPSPYLAYLSSKFPKIQIAAQDITDIDKDYGSYTGEVSAAMLKSCSSSYAIIGHSERVKIYSETTYMIRNKIKNCINHNIIPIICLGESQKIREKKNHLLYLEKLLYKLLPSGSNNIMLAYEPLWCIGRGVIPQESELQEVFGYINNCLSNINAKLLYGGSVDEKNIVDIKKIKGISGVLVGSTSLDIKSFTKLVNLNL